MHGGIGKVVKGFSKSLGVILASLLGFQSSLAFCVCHSGETHPTKQTKGALSQSASHEDKHPCHGHSDETQTHSSNVAIGQEHPVETDGHDQNHACCCIRKDETAVKSETCSTCFPKEKHTPVVFHSASVGDLSYDTLLLAKYCHSHAPPCETPLYLRLKSIRI